MLSILLRARGWPAQYPQAQFCFWLRDQGLLETVRDAVEAAGKAWLSELNNLYVSPVITGALMEADPDFASDLRAARQVLIHQFPQLATDISTEQFIESARMALTDDETLPLNRAGPGRGPAVHQRGPGPSAAITEVAEAVQTRFDSRVMLVGAGQSALSADTSALMWLRDRFRISVELSDST